VIILRNWRELIDVLTLNVYPYSAPEHQTIECPSERSYWLVYTYECTILEAEEAVSVYNASSQLPKESACNRAFKLREITSKPSFFVHGKAAIQLFTSGSNDSFNCVTPLFRRTIVSIFIAEAPGVGPLVGEVPDGTPRGTAGSSSITST
jgi:hypothetical protein